jgi:4-amino-4-deoxy-L-arabinose transferase-like glycosyltransferase
MQSSGLSLTCRRVGYLYVAVTALKLLLLIVISGSGRFKPFEGDNAKSLYLPISQRIVEEQRFNGPDSRADSKVPLGYPMFLAGCRWLVGDRYFLTLACGLQMVADLGVAGLIYSIGLGISNPRAAALAGLIWLVFPPAIIISTWITAENLFTLLLIASLAMLLAALSRYHPWLAFGAGLMLGVATLFRGTTLFLPLFLFPVWIWRQVPRGFEKGFAFLLGLALVIAPWMLRNRVVLHDPIPVATGFGSAFLQGSDTKFFTIAGKEDNYPAAFSLAADDGIPKPSPTARESLQDGYLLHVGLNQYHHRLRERPLSFVALAVEKALRLWYGSESGNFREQFVLGIVSLCVVPLGLWKVYQWRKTSSTAAAMIGGTILYFILLHWISLPEYRYVHPIMPLLVLAAAEAIESFSYSSL